MFPTSSHRKFWIFKSEDLIIQCRKESREKFITRHQGSRQTNLDYLSFDEDDILLKFFERKLMDFCIKFKPPMPKGVIGTTFVYFKRFYLYNSVMDYHPKEILVTAAYLACKVEEFNVSLEQFVSNINGNKDRATEIILNHELLLMSEIKFHLTVHTPWRPLEGLLIDIKTRFASNDPGAVESLRQDIDKFLTDVNFTNASLIYAPSQIALASIIHATSKQGHNLDAYVTKVLFGHEEGQENLTNIIEVVRNIRLMVKNVPALPSMAVIKTLCDRLEKCRNQDNNPDSQAYKRKIEELLDDDEERGSSKVARLNTYEDGQDMS